MKKIEAIIRKTKFEDVKEALLAADIEWFSYYDVRGEGKMRQARIYRGVMYDTSSIERMLLNIVVRDKNVEKTIAANSIQTVSTDIAKSCTLIIFYLLNMFTSNIYIFCMNPDLISPALRCKGQCRLSRPCVS